MVAILLMIYCSPLPRMGRNINKRRLAAHCRMPYGTQHIIRYRHILAIVYTQLIETNKLITF
jgi:hypothetical protein